MLPVRAALTSVPGHSTTTRAYQQKATSELADINVAANVKPTNPTSSTTSLTSRCRDISLASRPTSLTSQCRDLSRKRHHDIAAISMSAAANVSHRTRHRDINTLVPSRPTSQCRNVGLIKRKIAHSASPVQATTTNDLSGEIYVACASIETKNGPLRPPRVSHRLKRAN